MSLENVSLDVTVSLIDNNIKEKVGQLRYIIRGSDAEIFDTYLFPEYRRKKMMSSLLKKMIPELKMSGISKVKLKYFDEDARIAWEKMGFIHTGNEGYMELRIQ